MITEADTCRKYVLPKLYAAGWNDDQINEQKNFTDGRIVVIGTKGRRRPSKRADYLLRYARDFMLAVDVFIVRYNGDINRVAKPGIYKGSGPCYSVYPDKLMRLRPDRSKMSSEFLVFALCSESVREQVEEIGKTTAGNIGISGGNAKSFRVPVPPLSEQDRIVAELDALQAQVDVLKKLQADTAAELDALLPSILDKALEGIYRDYVLYL